MNKAAIIIVAIVISLIAFFSYADTLSILPGPAPSGSQLFANLNCCNTQYGISTVKLLGENVPQTAATAGDDAVISYATCVIKVDGVPATVCDYGVMHRIDRTDRNGETCSLVIPYSSLESGKHTAQVECKTGPFNSKGQANLRIGQNNYFYEKYASLCGGKYGICSYPQPEGDGTRMYCAWRTSYTQHACDTEQIDISSASSLLKYWSEIDPGLTFKSEVSEFIIPDKSSPPPADTTTHTVSLWERILRFFGFA